MPASSLLGARVGTDAALIVRRLWAETRKKRARPPKS